MGDLTADFSRAEFQCKCGCGMDNISLDLVNRLQRLRNILRKPITINSGCRCPAHNAAVGGAKNSSHLTTATQEGMAADIAVHSGREVYDLLTEINFYKLFTGIGIGKTLIHVDVAPSSLTRPRPWVWAYGDK